MFNVTFAITTRKRGIVHIMEKITSKRDYFHYFRSIIHHNKEIVEKSKYKIVEGTM